MNNVQKGKGEIGWPWWTKPHPQNFYFPYSKDWAGTKDFWIAVHEGQFAERIVAFVSAIKMHLKKGKMLDYLR